MLLFLKLPPQCGRRLVVSDGIGILESPHMSTSAESLVHWSLRNPLGIEFPGATATILQPLTETFSETFGKCCRRLLAWQTLPIHLLTNLATRAEVRWLWELMLWQQIDWRRMTHMTYESYDEGGETCGISTCLNWNPWRGFRRGWKGWNEMKRREKGGPQSEVKKHVRAKGGWPRLALPVRNMPSFCLLKWFRQPVDCARHAAQERGTEILGGPHWQGKGLSGLNPEHHVLFLSALEIPWKLCHQIPKRTLGILTCGWRMTPRRMRFLAWFRPWYMGEMFREWFQHRVYKASGPYNAIHISGHIRTSRVPQSDSHYLIAMND